MTEQPNKPMDEMALSTEILSTQLRIAEALERIAVALEGKQSPSVEPVPQEPSILDEPVSYFELSVRARKCLQRLEIHTVRQLVDHTQFELLTGRNLGESTLLEIKRTLAKHGLKLKGE